MKQSTKKGWFTFAIVAVPWAWLMFFYPQMGQGYLIAIGWGSLALVFYNVDARV